MNKIKLDIEIKPLVDFFNTLDGINTFGSCQGHDDGGETGAWLYPYIKFKCTNNRSLGLLATIEYLYADLAKLYDLPEPELKNIYQPSLNAIWTIEVVPIYDYNLFKNIKQDEFALYVLKANSDSFTKPSEIYPDFRIILEWYKSHNNSSNNDDQI